MSEFEELERPAEKNKGGRPKKPAVEPVKDSVVEKGVSDQVESEKETVDVALLVSENEALKKYINTTMADFQAKLDEMSGKPVDVPTGDVLDQSRPFSKTRNITGGLFYEQDGKEFDGAMRLKK